MKIGIISTAHREGTGAYRVLCELLHGNSGISAFEPVVVTPVDSLVGDEARLLGCRVVELRTAHDSLAANARALGTAMAALKDCDCVHAWHSRGFELAWYSGRRLGVPYSGTIHDHPRYTTHSLMRRGLLRHFGGRMRGLVFVGDAVRKAWGAIPRRFCKTVVVRNGLRDLPAERRCGDDLRIGFLGMYCDWKGFGIVEKWIRDLAEPRVAWRLYGDVHDSIRDAAGKLREEFSSTVSLCGNQPVARIFSEIDVLVHASTAFDPLPTVLIEAARAGIPVVASNLGGAAEIIAAGESGYLFDPFRPDDGLARLRDVLGASGPGAKMGEKAREIYEERFGLEGMVKGYYDFWSGLTRDKTTSPG